MRALLLLAALCAGCTCNPPVAAGKSEAELKKKCGAGDADACVSLGDLYARPESNLEGSLLPARKKPCAMGSGLGCRKLGELLRDGDYPHRVNVDPSGSTQAFEKGCALSDGPSCTAWASRLESGRGASADAAAAADAYARGCELGDGPACDGLNPLLELKRSSLEANAPRAAALYARVCDAGVKQGCKSAEALRDASKP